MAKPPVDFINDLGGPHKVAKMVGKRPGAVRMWMQRRTIPRGAWPEIIDAYPDVTMDDLRDVERAGQGPAV